MFKEKLFTGKVFLVTGATSGIGKVVAAELVKYGAKVIVAGRNSARIQETIEAISASGGECFSSLYDFKQADETAAWIKSLASQYGPLDGCFHSAGLEFIKPVRLNRNDDIDKIFSPTLFGALGIAKAFGSRNVASEGASLVFMSSVSAFAGQSGMSLYASSKSALSGLVKSLACEFSPKSIRVNAIAAGAVETEMHERLMGGAEPNVIEAYRGMHLLGFGHATDVANAALFLLSDGSKWITGTDMIVDGGYLSK